MTKRRITRKQASRIQKRQTERQQRALKNLEHIGTEELGPEQTGLLIAHFGTMADIEDDAHHVSRCYLRQHLGMLAAGDKVIWQAAKNQTGVVVAVCERESVLGRPDATGQIKPVAANLDQMLIVVACQPVLIPSLLDSYLVAAETLTLHPMIIVNKMDLLNETQTQAMQAQLTVYQALGYTIIYTSTMTDAGLNPLLPYLNNKTSVFIGQSGVGKSSLISQLLPQADIRIAERDIAEGGHTTTTSRLYHLPSGGDLIDSPGIREFGLWHMTVNDIANGFIELRPFLGKCKFRDCHHQTEPACAIRDAVQDGKISEERFECFLKLADKEAT